jgi:tol-pal system protein YbgF
MKDVKLAFSNSYVQTGRWPVLAGAFVLGSLLLVLSEPAQAQSDMESRLTRMERDIETMSRTVYKGEAPPAGTIIGAGSAAANLQTEDRINQIEQDLRELTGRVEEQGNSIVQIRNQLDRTLADLQMRVAGVEQRLGIAPAIPPGTTPPQSPTPAIDGSIPATPMNLPPAANEPAPATSPTVQPLGTTVDAPVGTPPSDPMQAYENAIALLKQRDYVVAEKSLEEFIRTYPGHDLTQNAKYWLGESYFAQNKYDKAARIFAEGYQQYPKGPKAPDNLLKMGLSLAALGNTADACVALQQIGKEYATGANAVNTRAKAEIKRLKCGG